MDSRYFDNTMEGMPQNVGNGDDLSKLLKLILIDGFGHIDVTKVDGQRLYFENGYKISELAKYTLTTADGIDRLVKLKYIDNVEVEVIDDISDLENIVSMSIKPKDGWTYEFITNQHIFTNKFGGSLIIGVGDDYYCKMGGLFTANGARYPYVRGGKYFIFDMDGILIWSMPHGQYGNLSQYFIYNQHQVIINQWQYNLNFSQNACFGVSRGVVYNNGRLAYMLGYSGSYGTTTQDVQIYMPLMWDNMLISSLRVPMLPTPLPTKPRPFCEIVDVGGTFVMLHHAESCMSLVWENSNDRTTP